MAVKSISATELQTRLQNGDQLFLLDVREPNEFAYARIENSVLIPLGQIPYKLTELDPQQEIVAICHHGVRSMQACQYLVRSGFENVWNLTGGIDAWSCNCDSSVQRY